VFVDIHAEIEAFPWIRPRWSADKLIAASPFRYDHSPSFYVYLTDTATAKAGDWGDSGAIDSEWARGGIVKLLAFLRNETEFETLEYLREKYGYADADTFAEPMLSLPTLHAEVKRYRQTLDRRILDGYKYRHPYLSNRGISEAVQRLMTVGYDKYARAVTIPWFNADGTLGNIMYRSVSGKTFWFASGGRPIREMLYGIDVIYRKRLTRAVIVEAPIDAMTVMTAGIPSVAIGGTAFSAYKRDLIIRSPLKEVVIMADHDSPGQALKRKVIAELSPYMTVKVAGYPARYKDVNEMAVATKSAKIIQTFVERAKAVKSLAGVGVAGL
jgi:5S rRNA maturation endonuclease (ribonuclease M5)